MIVFLGHPESRNCPTARQKVNATRVTIHKRFAKAHATFASRDQNRRAGVEVYGSRWKFEFTGSPLSAGTHPGLAIFGGGAAFWFSRYKGTYEASSVAVPLWLKMFFLPPDFRKDTTECCIAQKS